MRGDMNAVLNRLIGEGVITALETNFAGISALGIVQVVAADVVTDPHIPGYDRPKVLAVRNRVTKELEGVGAADVIVSVRSSLK